MNIVEKIKALLAKAKSTDNEHEAEIFLAKAYELMEKHQLGAEDLERDDPVRGEATYRRADRGGVDWDFHLLFAVAKYYGCKGCRTNGWDSKTGKPYYEMDLVGRESAQITAIEMHKYLVSTVRRLGREKAHTIPVYNDDGYRIGYMNADQTARSIGNALRQRLYELARLQERKDNAPTDAGKNALVTLDRVLAVYQERHPDATTIKGRYHTTGAARDIANGIGLNLQAGAGAGNVRIGSN